ncbi:FAD binding domain-containing protein [Lichenicoccus sp.]|uniref:FAD binding domain-containing protein n=1 Tax=Lichenicoccus sp. TaxID=2781899 RepID=UPI003D0D0AF2
MDLNTIREICRPAGREQLPAWQAEDALLAGGTWLYSEPQPQLRRLVDLSTLAWPSLHTDAAGLCIAATCTLAELAAWQAPPGWRAAPLLGLCCQALLGSFKICNAATVGGNLCLALPAGPMIALAIALDGVCHVWKPDGGERRISAEEFVLGPQMNALQRGEVLRHIDLPAAAFMRRFAIRRISLSPLGRSAALLIGTLSAEGGMALVVSAATLRPARLDFAGLPDEASLRRRIAQDITRFYEDVHGAADWRQHLVFLLAEEIRCELEAVQP